MGHLVDYTPRHASPEYWEAVAEASLLQDASLTPGLLSLRDQLQVVPSK